MLKKILVPVDGSDTAFNALNLAMVIGEKFDSELIVVNVEVPYDYTKLPQRQPKNELEAEEMAHGLDPRDSVTGAKDKPLLISEHNGHMFPTKQIDFPARRLEHALRHLRVMDDAYAEDRICGAIGWCAFDYNTHKDFGSGDHICYHEQAFFS